MSQYLDTLAELGVGGAHPGGLRLTKKILETLFINEKTKILDVGCGTGQTMAFIAQQYECVVKGIDSQKKMVEKANQRFKDLQLSIQSEVGFVEALPFESNSFDYLLSESVLTFTDLEEALKEIKRVLKKDGKLIAVEMVMEKVLPAKDLKKLQDFYGFKQFLMEEDWRKRLSSSGFRYIHIEKEEREFSDADLEQVPDFQLSENVDESYFQLLIKHQELTARYAEFLGYRIIKSTLI